MMNRTTAAVLFVMSLGLLPHAVLAHPLAPSLVELEESAAGLTSVRLRTPRARALGTELRVQLPTVCRPLAQATSATDDVAIERVWTVDCGDHGLLGQRVGVEGLEGAGTAAVVRVRLADGRRLEGVISAHQPWFEIAAAPARAAMARQLGILGIRHVLTGFDHLLFVFGLTLLAASWPSLLKTVTAFTLGHSVTLSLAVLGWIVVPAKPIELGIALSVLTLAIALARDAPHDRIRDRPWLMAATFGLLHGLGFAAALTEADLPRAELPLALLSFNLGIEAGQLAFVAVVVLLRWGIATRVARLPNWARVGPVYAMGILASFWCFERVAALLE